MARKKSWKKPSKSGKVMTVTREKSNKKWAGTLTKKGEWGKPLGVLAPAPYVLNAFSQHLKVGEELLGI